MHLTPGDIPELLRKAKTVAIVGISDKADRASYGVANYLIENSHFELFFVNPLLESVLGQKVYKSLTEIETHLLQSQASVHSNRHAPGRCKRAPSS